MAGAVLRACCIIALSYFSAADFPYKTGEYDQYVDHFNFVNNADQLFKQRYLYQDKHWGGDGSPIFFYAGNEDSIESFWQSAGFIHEIAPQFKAFVVFTEHRYYGGSLPFGSQSFTKSNLGLLTVDQAIADYTTFLTDLKNYLNAPTSRIIAFGGSYGGMLAAYLRYRHPTLVHGALAASSPVLMQAPDGPHDFFFSRVTKVFREHSEKCYQAVKLAFAQQLDYSRQGIPGLDEMVKKMRLCSPIHSDPAFRVMQVWARFPFVDTAMSNYPYPVGTLPGNPVAAACTTMLNQEDPLVGLVDVAGLVYNVTGSKTCYNISEEYFYCGDPTGCGFGNDAQAWDFQTCADLILPNGSNNKTDMFPESPWNPDMRRQYCQYKFGFRPRVAWDVEEFFGLDLTYASNIIFSNGNLDPWMGGGVNKNISDTVIALTVEGGAHHLDLRASNKLDPPGVVTVREQEKTIIASWLEQ